MPEVKLSIIIVNWNTKPLLGDCLHSIYNETKNILFEIILVDNGSTDGSMEMVEREFPKVKLIINHENLGFTKANNQAIKESKGEYILLLNSDTQIKDSAIEKTVDYISRNKKVGILGCKLINPGNVVELSCRTFPEPEIVWYINNPFKRIYHEKSTFKKYFMNNWKHDQIQEVDWVTGAYLLTRREILMDIGLLDESYFTYFDDIDLCWRVKIKGWKIIFLPYAEVFHVKGYTDRKKSFSDRATIMQLKGFLMFSEKHYPEEKANQVRKRVRLTSWLQIINIYLWDFYKIWKRDENQEKIRSYLNLIKSSSKDKP
jgi:GT2 family glycosyltransferase